MGKLTRGERFVFEYTGCSEAEKCGWERLEVFPEEKRYESETLFSIEKWNRSGRESKSSRKITETFV